MTAGSNRANHLMTSKRVPGRTKSSADGVQDIVGATVREVSALLRYVCSFRVESSPAFATQETPHVSNTNPIKCNANIHEVAKYFELPINEAALQLGEHVARAMRL